MWAGMAATPPTASTCAHTCHSDVSLSYPVSFLFSNHRHQQLHQPPRVLLFDITQRRALACTSTMCTGVVIAILVCVSSAPPHTYTQHHHHNNTSHHHKHHSTSVCLLQTTPQSNVGRCLLCMTAQRDTCRAVPTSSRALHSPSEGGLFESSRFDRCFL